VDDEREGDAVRAGEDEPERGGLGESDGRGEDDAECDGAREVAPAGDGTVWTAVGTEARGRVTAGDGVTADTEAVALARARLPEKVATPASARVTWTCAADEATTRLALEWAVRESAKVSIVTITAATAHTTMAATATAHPWLARMVLHRVHLTAREYRASQADSARRTTRRR